MSSDTKMSEGKFWLWMINLKNRSVLLNMLEPIGFEVFEGVNGKQALAKASEIKPDLILMDLVMPVMDGFEVTRQLRKISGFKNIPVIALSASVFEDNKNQSRKAGCDDFISKPVRAELLFEMLKKYLKLEWIYDTADLKAAEKIKDIRPTLAVLKTPPTEELGHLSELAKIGDIQGVLTRLKKIEDQDSDKKYAPFLEELYKLAKSYNMKKIRKFIQQFQKSMG